MGKNPLGLHAFSGVWQKHGRNESDHALFIPSGNHSGMPLSGGHTHKHKFPESQKIGFLVKLFLDHSILVV